MEIKILGSCCAGCKALHQTVEQAVAELEIEATVSKEQDMMQIMRYNIISLPALVINEVVVSSGKRLSTVQVKEYITNAKELEVK